MTDPHDWPIRPPLDDPFDESWDGAVEDPEWFLDLLEGTLSPRDTRRVRDLLDRDPELARRYASYCEKVDLLHELGTQDAVLDGGAALRERILTATVAGGAGGSAPEAPRSATNSRGGDLWAWMGVVTMAAASLALFFSLREGAFHTAPNVANEAAQDATEPPGAVAPKGKSGRRAPESLEGAGAAAADKRGDAGALDFEAVAKPGSNRSGDGLAREQSAARARRFVAKKVEEDLAAKAGLRPVESEKQQSDPKRRFDSKKRFKKPRETRFARREAARTATQAKGKPGRFAPGAPKSGGPSTPGPAKGGAAGPSSPRGSLAQITVGRRMRQMVDSIEQVARNRTPSRAKLGAPVKPLVIVDQERPDANRLAALAQSAEIKLYGSTVVDFGAGWLAFRGGGDRKAIDPRNDRLRDREAQKGNSNAVPFDLFHYAVTNPARQFEVYKATGTRQAFVGFLTQLNAKPNVYYSAVPESLFKTSVALSTKSGAGNGKQSADRTLEERAKLRTGAPKVDDAKRTELEKELAEKKRVTRGGRGRRDPVRSVDAPGKKAKKPADQLLELYLLIKSKKK